MKRFITYSILLVMMAFSSCRTDYSVVSVEGGRVPITSVYENSYGRSSDSILNVYKLQVDSIMCPVIGHAQKKLVSFRPESPLSNLMADLLRDGAEKKLGFKPEVGVMNMGGIRNIMNQGEITIGEVFEIAPFQNALSVVTLKGEVLLDLFGQIASLGGEGLSGARLVISKDGKLLSAEVGGQPINPNSEYRIATIDYVADGNDRMVAFKKAIHREEPKNSVLRDLFIEYIKECELNGRMIDSEVEGRIVIK